MEYDSEVWHPSVALTLNGDEFSSVLDCLSPVPSFHYTWIFFFNVLYFTHLFVNCMIFLFVYLFKFTIIFGYCVVFCVFISCTEFCMYTCEYLTLFLWMWFFCYHYYSFYVIPHKLTFLRSWTVVFRIPGLEVLYLNLCNMLLFHFLVIITGIFVM